MNIQTILALLAGIIVDVVFCVIVFAVNRYMKRNLTIMEFKERVKAKGELLTQERIYFLIEEIKRFFEPVENFQYVHKIEHKLRYDGSNVITLQLDYVETDQSFLTRSRTLDLIKLCYDLGLDFTIYPDGDNELRILIIFEIL